MADSTMMRSDNSITPQLIKQEGAGKAYQSVAQSTALAIQDAVDNLRNINTVSTTAQGVAMAQMIATGLPQPWTDILAAAQAMSAAAVVNFSAISAASAAALNAYPTGS